MTWVVIHSYVREKKAVFINELPTTLGDIQQVCKSIVQIYVYEGIYVLKTKTNKRVEA